MSLKQLTTPSLTSDRKAGGGGGGGSSESMQGMLLRKIFYHFSAVLTVEALCVPSCTSQFMIHVASATFPSSITLAIYINRLLVTSAGIITEHLFLAFSIYHNTSDSSVFSKFALHNVWLNVQH